MNSRHRAQIDLLERIHGFVVASESNELTDDRWTDFERLLCESDDACRLYAEYMDVSFFLPSVLEAMPDKDSVSPHLFFSEQQTAPCSAPSFLGSAWHGAFGYFSSGWPVAYLMATVIYAIGLLIGSLVPVSQPAQVARQTVPLPSPLSPLPTMVGRITGMVDCRWEQNLEIPNPKAQGPRPKTLVSFGDKFALASGLMEITYDTGAKVILQGPVTYEVESRSSGYLSVGKLTARLEKKVASGQWSVASKSEFSNPQSLIPNPSLSTNHYPLFTIRTPTATLTDLGTEFGVLVDRAGVTESYVFRGAVRVQPCSATHGGQEEIGDLVVRENESIRIGQPTAAGSQQQVAIIRQTAEPGRFVRKLPPSAKSLPVHVWAYFRLGEDDPGATPGQPAGERTMEHGRRPYLQKHGSPTYTADTAAPGSRLAMDFTGAPGACFSTDRFGWTPNDNFILEAWVRLNRVGSDHMYIAYNGDSGANGYGLLVWDGRWQFMLGKLVTADSGVPCQPGKWTHLALVCQQGSTQLWVNGRPASQPRDLVPIIPDILRTPLVIGGYPGDRVHSFDGQIDEVRISEFLGPFSPKMLLFPADKSVPSPAGRKGGDATQK